MHNKDDMTEAEYLDSQSDLGADDDCREHEREMMQRLYYDAKRAEVGTSIRCPTCEKLIVKSTYHKTFCNSKKTKGRSSCKDYYHNVVTEKFKFKGRE